MELTATGFEMSRSMGMKLIVVSGLILLMMIPAFFVDNLIGERVRRATEVKTEIGKHVGGAQTFLGPTLAIPYKIGVGTINDPVKRGVYLAFPAQASAVVKTSTEERHRSLFRVPVYQADLKFDATFDLTDVPNAPPDGAQLDWSDAEFIVGVSDAHGALVDATLTAGQNTMTLVPAAVTGMLSIKADDSRNASLALFGARPLDAIKPGGTVHVTAAMKFSGAERIAVLAYGKTTQLSEQGDWRNPGFDGAILPVSQSVGDKGFSARWYVPFIARGVRAQGPADSFGALSTVALGMSFVEIADAYQSVSRSMKYVLLFEGLVFLSYFVFEVTSGKRVHPAQYILVGIAQLIFYLLLLSVSERTGFDAGFLIAGVATVTLLASNAGWVFASRLQAIRAASVFTLLYALIYLLLRLEDNALLVGAIASFVAVATAMYLTRGIDWYGSARDPERLSG